MINIIELKQQYLSIKDEIDNSIQEVLLSTQFINASFVKTFENNFSEYSGSKYSISCNSGTDALYLALRSLDIKEDHEIITTPLTFIATAEAISLCNAKPVFSDIRLDTYNIDVKEIEEKITKKTKAIIPVHLYGQMCEMDKIKEIADKYNLYIIEDCAQSVGSKYKNIKCGNWGDAGCFSFYPSKNLGAYGDAGIIISNDENIYKKSNIIKDHGSISKYEHNLLGINSRMDSIQAVILNIKLKYIDIWNKKRIEIANYYTNNLKDIDEIITPYNIEESYSVYHQYTIRTDKRDELKKYLYDKGINTMIYYPIPLHLQKVYSNLNYKYGNFPNTEEACDTILSLPIYPELEEDKQNYIIECIRKFFKC